MRPASKKSKASRAPPAFRGGKASPSPSDPFTVCALVENRARETCIAVIKASHSSVLQVCVSEKQQSRADIGVHESMFVRCSVRVPCLCACGRIYLYQSPRDKTMHHRPGSWSEDCVLLCRLHTALPCLSLPLFPSISAPLSLRGSNFKYLYVNGDQLQQEQLCTHKWCCLCLQRR